MTSATKEPVIRELKRDPTLPMLKRRRISLSNGENDVVASITSGTTPTKTEPLIRDATEEEAAAKRKELTVPDNMEELGDMDASNNTKKEQEAKLIGPGYLR